MAPSTQHRDYGLPQGNQDKLQALKEGARTHGTRDQQEDVGDLVEYIPDPTPTPCTARELREAMTDEEFNRAIAAAPTPQAKHDIERIKRLDPSLSLDEDLWYRWYKNRNQYYLLDLPTLKSHANWIHDITYEKDKPSGQKAGNSRQSLATEACEEKKRESRDAARSDRMRRAEGRVRKRSSGSLERGSEDTQEELDHDEIHPPGRGFGTFPAKRKRSSNEESRWVVQSEAERGETDAEEENDSGNEDNPSLLEPDEGAPDLIAELRQRHGDLLEVVYLDTVTAAQLQKLLLALELPVPKGSKQDRRDDFKDALLEAKNNDRLPDYIVLMQNDLVKAQSDRVLAPTDALERHIQSGVNYENGKATLSLRRHNRNEYAFRG